MGVVVGVSCDSIGCVVFGTCNRTGFFFSGVEGFIAWRRMLGEGLWKVSVKIVLRCCFCRVRRPAE